MKIPESERLGFVGILEISWKGHDFLDSVRDPKIWKKTKDGALAAGGTVELLVGLAKGFAKSEIEKSAGIKL